MILSKSKIYEMKMIVLELKDVNFSSIYLDYSYGIPTKRFYNCQMYDASHEGYEKLTYFLVSKGANDYFQGLYEAVEGEREKLIDFFISIASRISENYFCMDIWGSALSHAYSEKLIQFFTSKIK